MSDHLTASTRAEYEDQLAMGCTPMTPVQLRAAAAQLGYRLDTDKRSTCAVGSYTNNHTPPNGRAYRAFGVSWTDTRTSLGFAHVDADRSQLPELQELRCNTVVFHRGRVWEL